jgi:hypothetical protein
VRYTLIIEKNDIFSSRPKFENMPSTAFHPKAEQPYYKFYTSFGQNARACKRKRIYRKE